MPGKPVTSVIYNRGGTDVPALVLEDEGGTKLTLAAPNESNLLQVEYGVPEREPKDYDEKGGGGTWHE